jgi:hypothetical protein
VRWCGTQLCHAAGGELEQIHFFRDVSLQTAERYLGKQRLRLAGNDKIGLEP